MRWLVAAVVLLGHGVVAANGRVPATNGVTLHPEDNNFMLVRTTFGPLISRDAGCTFRWLCEQNIGYGGEFDPQYRVARDGTIFATTFRGLRVSRNGGCSFETATSSLPAGDPNRVADIWIDALDIAPDGTVWVASAETGRVNDVFQSKDNGLTFTPMGRSSTTTWWKSVKAAPSRSDTVYLSGYEVGSQQQAHLFRTDTAGTSWTELPLAGIAFGQTPVVKILAIDPTTPETVFLVSQNTDNTNGERLYRSIDGGTTWLEVLMAPAPIRGIVIDGSKVTVAVGTAGAFASIDGGTTFAAVVGAPQLSCLERRPDGTVIGCGTNWQPDFKSVASSSDLAEWTKLFRFVELAGPVECPAGTMQRDVCDVEQWTALKEQFAATGPTCGAPPPEVDGPPPVTNEPGGCCDSSNSPPLVGLAWVLVMFGWRRRSASRG